MKNLDQKFSQAKAKLLVEYPYFGTLASRLELIRNDNQATFSSNGSKYEYNDDFIGELDLDELSFTLSNASMHAVLAHENRQKGRVSWLWQLSTDYAINDMLVQNGLDLPFGLNYDARFEGMYAEEIYAILKDEITNEALEHNEESDADGSAKSENEHNTSPQNTHNGKKAQIETADVEKALLEAQWDKLKDEVQKKYQADLPDTLERFVSLHESLVDWKEALFYAIDRFAYNDYKLLPPSKKLLYLGTYLPALYSNQLSLTVAIDTSGSVDEILLSHFIAELESIMISFSNFEIDLITCDAKVHSYQHFSMGDAIEYDLKGGGGTDFNPVFEFIDKELNQPQLLLYFTDLDGKFPENEPLYKVIWVTSNDIEVPFGETILLQQ